MKTLNRKQFFSSDLFNLPKWKKKKGVLKRLLNTFDIHTIEVKKTKGTMPKNNKQSKKSSQKTGSKGKNQNSNRHFVGGGWDNTGEYGFFGNLQINKDQFNELPADNYGNVKLTVATRKVADERSGMDLMVYAELDE